LISHIYKKFLINDKNLFKITLNDGRAGNYKNNTREMGYEEY